MIMTRATQEVIPRRTQCSKYLRTMIQPTYTWMRVAYSLMNLSSYLNRSSSNTNSAGTRAGVALFNLSICLRIAALLISKLLSCGVRGRCSCLRIGRLHSSTRHFCLSLTLPPTGITQPILLSSRKVTARALRAWWNFRRGEWCTNGEPTGRLP